MHAPSSHYFWQVFGIFFVPFFLFFSCWYFSYFFDVFYGKAACIEHFVLVNCACCTRRMRYMRARTPRMHCTYAQLCSGKPRKFTLAQQANIFTDTLSICIFFSLSPASNGGISRLYSIYIYVFFEPPKMLAIFHVLAKIELFVCKVEGCCLF